MDAHNVVLKYKSQSFRYVVFFDISYVYLLTWKSTYLYTSVRIRSRNIFILLYIDNKTEPKLRTWNILQTYTCIHTYIYTCIHTYVRTCVRTYMHTYMFVVYFDGPAQASDFRIERKQVVFLCWMQNSKESLWHQIASRLNAHSQTELSRIKQKLNSTARPYDEWARDELLGSSFCLILDNRAKHLVSFRLKNRLPVQEQEQTCITPDAGAKTNRQWSQVRWMFTHHRQQKLTCMHACWIWRLANTKTCNITTLPVLCRRRILFASPLNV